MSAIQFIDTHAHLDDPRFNEDSGEVIKRAQEAGVGTIITVGCWEPESGFRPVASVLARYPQVYAALGVHPHDAAKIKGDAPYELIRDLKKELGSRLVAVGETGLDYHYMNSPREVQREAFSRHIELARELALPLVVHTREAEEDTLELLGREANGVGVVIHCFSGSLGMAEKCLEMGCYISLTGAVTFPKAGALREVVKKIPIERILLETDCPYLAPKPWRGRRNEPSYVVETARVVADSLGLSLADVARITTLNAGVFFGLAGRFGVEKSGRPEPGGDGGLIAYAIRDSLYLNITNRCTNRCTFCAKFDSFTVKGHYLKLNKEPDLEDVLEAVGPEPGQYKEIVFCGYGEPLLRLDIVKDAGRRFKRAGCRVRIDTDGLANLVHGRNVLPELDFVDSISISMNAPDQATYESIIETPYKGRAFGAVLDFIREAREFIPEVVATVVGVPGLDIDASRLLAERDLGVSFRVREYNEVG